MRKKPYRPTNEITQQYNSGVVKIYRAEDVSEPGGLPVIGLTLKGTLRYEEMRLGLTRFYTAKQNNVEIERVIRTMRRSEISSQDVAITEDGKQYRIDMVQSVKDVFPASMDLTLAIIEQVYEVPNGVV